MFQYFSAIEYVCWLHHFTVNGSVVQFLQINGNVSLKILLNQHCGECNLMLTTNSSHSVHRTMAYVSLTASYALSYMLMAFRTYSGLSVTFGCIKSSMIC